jgi:hypothetical protein
VRAFGLPATLVRTFNDWVIRDLLESAAIVPSAIKVGCGILYDTEAVMVWQPSPQSDNALLGGASALRVQPSLGAHFKLIGAHQKESLF